MDRTAAVQEFLTALDEYETADGFNPRKIVEALLKAGWLPPSEERRLRGLILDELVREAADLGLYEKTAEPRRTR